MINQGSISAYVGFNTFKRFNTNHIDYMVRHMVFTQLDLFQVLTLYALIFRKFRRSGLIAIDSWNFVER